MAYSEQDGTVIGKMEQMTAKEFRAWRKAQHFRTTELSTRAMQMEMNLHVLETMPESAIITHATFNREMAKFLADYEASK